MNSFLDNFFHRKRFRKIIRHIPVGAVVCDIGCGEKAIFLKTVSSSIKKGIGLDAKIENCRDRNLELRKLNIEKMLPLESESCDIITMAAVVEHLSHPREILSECFRSLKKGGKLLITTPAPLAKPILDFLAFKLHLIDENEIRDHKQYFRPKDLNRLLVAAGFEEKNIESSFFEFFLNSLTIAKK